MGVMGRRGEDAEETAALVRGRGGEGVSLVADVRSSVQIHDAIRSFVDDRAGLSAAVNCAGVDISHYLADYSVEEFDRVFETNTRGLFCCMQEEIALMRAGGGGAIVNVTSVAGLRPFLSNSVYNASKSAASMLTRTAAAEEGPNGIRINEIAPGPIDTPMLRKFFEDAKSAGWDLEKLRQSQPLRRIGSPEDVAYAAVFLASSRAAYICGACLAIDGGMSLV